MLRRLVLLGLMAFFAVVLVKSAPDIARYAKIKGM